MDVTLVFIGQSADDLRFFIRADGVHAGGITVHGVSGNCFSYGIAVAKHMRRQGIAKAALPLLFDVMRTRGFARVVAEIAPENTASIALHKSLGFMQTSAEIPLRFQKIIA